MKAATPGIILSAILTVILITAVAAPLLYSAGSFFGLDGSILILDNRNVLSSADPLTAFVYGLGDIMCHQEAARSFIINGSQTAFCHRDMAFMFGLAMGLPVIGRFSARYDICSMRVVAIGLLLIFVTFAEWGLEYVSNTDLIVARVFTGLLAGIGAALLFQHIVFKQYLKIMEGV